MSSPPVSGLANPKPFLRSNHLIMAVCCAALSSACAQGAVASQWGAVRVRVGGKGGGVVGIRDAASKSAGRTIPWCSRRDRSQRGDEPGADGRIFLPSQHAERERDNLIYLISQHADEEIRSDKIMIDKIR
jgi:hypothetical protein